MKLIPKKQNGGITPRTPGKVSPTVFWSNPTAEKESLFSTIMNTPQKVMMYGATTFTRGFGNGVYDTPSKIIKKDWKIDNKTLGLTADLTLDPLNLLPASKLGGIKAMRLNQLKQVYNTLRTGTNLFDNFNEVDNATKDVPDDLVKVKKPE